MEAKNIIDTHVHFFKAGQYHDPDWPEPGTSIYRDFTLEDYKEDVKKLKNINTKGIIYAQVYHNDKETEDIIELSKRESLIRGIIGWTNLKSENIEANLKRLKIISNGRLVGIRHLTQTERFDWLWQDEVQRGLKCLEASGLACDLCFNPPCLKHAPKLASIFPNMTFVIDHLAKPEGYGFSYEAWFEDLKEASKYPNMFCKLSGYVPQRIEDWSVEAFEPFIKHALDSFGYERCMYGADWPVFKLGKNCEIDNNFHIIDTIVTKHFNNDPKIWNDIFHNNALRIYKILD